MASRHTVNAIRYGFLSRWPIQTSRLINQRHTIQSASAIVKKKRCKWLVLSSEALTKLWRFNSMKLRNARNFFLDIWPTQSQVVNHKFRKALMWKHFRSNLNGAPSVSSLSRSLHLAKQTVGNRLLLTVWKTCMKRKQSVRLLITLNARTIEIREFSNRQTETERERTSAAANSANCSDVEYLVNIWWIWKF